MTRERVDDVWIEVGGRRLSHWTSYSFDSDLFTPADGFRFTVGLPSARTEADRRTRDELLALVNRGATVRIYVGDSSTEETRAQALQLTGIVDDRTIDVTPDGGSVLEIEGRDLARHLVDSSVPIDLFRVSSETRRRMLLVQNEAAGSEARALAERISTQADTGIGVGVWSPSQFVFEVDSAAMPGRPYTITTGPTLAQLARLVCDPWRIPVVCDQSAARDVLTGRPRRGSRRGDDRRAIDPSSYAAGLAPNDVKTIKPDEARPSPGETCWEYLDRHAKRLGVLLWMAPTGELVLGSPQYGQAPRARIVRRLRSDPSDPNNVIRGEVRESLGDRYSKVTVYGRSGRDPAKSKIVATAIDSDWPGDFETPLVVHDRAIREQAEADRRALRELAKHKRTARTIKYDVSGHSCAMGRERFVFAIDTVIEVLDEVAGISGRYYCTKRTLARDRERGTTATLVLVEPGSIVL